MGDKTGIEWTDATWNPIAGCARVSPGCDNCYALKLHNRRYKANMQAGMMLSGLVEDGSRHIRGWEGWRQNVQRVGAPPEGWAARGRSLGVRMPLPAQYDLPFTRVQLLPDRLDAPLRWRRPRRIFVNSMSDLFHEDVPDEFIDQVFARMRAAWQHTFQVLTKRPERMLAYLSDPERSQLIRHIVPPKIAADLERLAAHPTRQRLQDKHADWYAPENWCWPLPNVQAGVSVENQRSADERIPLLLETPAAVRFVSAEPLLGPVDLMQWTLPVARICGPAPRIEALQYALRDVVKAGGKKLGWNGIDWVIAGGESGGPPERRLVEPCVQPWHDTRLAFCAHCDGSNWRPTRDGLAWVRSLRDQCGAAGVPFLFKQWGGPRPTTGGRLLDGRTCDEFPAGKPSSAILYAGVPSEAAP